MDETSKLSAVPVKDAVVSEGKVEGAQETFWFERNNGSVFSVLEEEAWNIMKGRTSIVGFRHNIPKLIGVSDGNIFQRAVLESQGLLRDGKVEEAQAVLKKGQQEELESGRGKIKRPRDFDTVDRRGKPISISELR